MTNALPMVQPMAQAVIHAHAPYGRFNAVALGYHETQGPQVLACFGTYCTVPDAIEAARAGAVSAGYTLAPAMQPGTFITRTETN